MSSVWEPLRAAMGELLAICTREQEALVTMQAERVALVQSQKAGLLGQVHRLWTELSRQAPQTPADIVALADQCRRVNDTNRSMLSITLQCIDNLMKTAGCTPAATYGPNGNRAMNTRFMDVRI